MVLQEWLCEQLDRFISTVPVEGGRSSSLTSGDDYLEIPEIERKTSQSLSSVLKDYRELADTCLLVLHIEVRVHCFYYLMPVAKQVCLITNRVFYVCNIPIMQYLTGIPTVTESKSYICP